MTNVVSPDGLRVLKKQCETCIFHPGNLMDLRTGRLAGLVKEALAKDGFIPCHETLPDWTGNDGLQAICRGFWDRYDTQIVQLARRLNFIKEISLQPEAIAQVTIDITLQDVIAAAAYDLLDQHEQDDDEAVAAWIQSRTVAELVESVKAQILSNLERDRENSQEGYGGASAWDFMAEQVELRWNQIEETE